MDNEAFRALVNQSRPGGSDAGGAKSTKEIAREAVEDEFERKRRRGGGGGRRGGRGADAYGSDSGGSSDEEDLDRPQKGKEAKPEEEEEPEWKRRRREKKAATEYRDRAKERREGKSSEYASLEGLAQSGVEEEDRQRREELSKYLGGDEEHTHLVKGLDKALAEKVRREGMGGGSKEGELDDLLEEAYVTKQGKRGSGDWRMTKPKSELGKSVLGYLLEKSKSEGVSPTRDTVLAQTKGNPTIQKSIQRSVLTFSTNADVRRRKAAWEAPGTSVRSFPAGDGDGNARRMAPLNRHMIATISKKLDGRIGKEKERSRYGSVAKDGGANGKKLNGGQGRADGAKDEPAKDGADEGAKVNAGTDGDTTKEEDSDDDIFADAGEYVPPVPVPVSSEQAYSAPADGENGKDGKAPGDGKDDGESAKDTAKQKQSIFDNLLPDTAPVAPIPARRPQQSLSQHDQQQQQKQPNKKVIDRDIFGGQPEQASPYHKRRGPQMAAMEGVSMTTYQGGYGEEMDVDFGGYDDERRKKKKDDDEEKEDGGGGADDDDDEG